MQLPQPQAMPVRKLTQTQPACPVLVNPPRTLSAPVRQCSVSISFHAATVASRLDRRLDAPRLPLTFQRWLVADEDAVPDIALNTGLNVLVFKVVNGVLDWKGCIRFTDAKGNPVKGIEVTLDPEEKDSPSKKL